MAVFAATVLSVASSAEPALAQSQSGFTYNGMVYVSYQANEYQQSPAGAQGLAAVRATGANYTAIVATQYEQTYTANVIAPETTSTPGYDSSKDPLSPTDAAVTAAIKNAQGQGLTVFLKPQVDSLDGVFRGKFAPADPTAWFQSYRTFLLHYAELASSNGVGGLVIGTELASLSGAAYAANWDNLIADVRAQYPNLTLVYGANATSSNDEFTTVSFWDKVDVIGVDGYFPLTNHADPTVAELVAAWTKNKSGFNIVAALKALQSKYNKPLIFTELGYVSAAGTNEAPYNLAAAGAAYDPTEQQNCYEAFFEVFSQQSSWMKGVFWWAWTVTAPGSSDRGYTPQNKPAATVALPKWFGSSEQGFTLTPSNSRLTVGGGLSVADTISVTSLGGFSGRVALAATGLPSGVSATFTSGSAPGTQVLNIVSDSSAAVGASAITITGTSGTLSATTTIALNIQATSSQTITFAQPPDQTVGTPLSLTASSSSGLPVSFSTQSTNVCTVNNATATFLAAGTCTITASQSGNSTYAPATPVSISFQVAALPPVAVPAADNVIVSQVNWLRALPGYVQTSNNATGGSFGVNTAGQVAIADTNSLMLVNAQSGAATTLGAWSGASAVAVDGKNNIYVGTLYGAPAAIVKVPYTGSTTNGGYATFITPSAATPACTTSGTTECVVSAVGSLYPSALAFDAKGNLFWVNSSSGASAGNSIYECSAACLAGSGSPVQLFQEPTASATPSASSGQLLIGGLSVDSTGNIFFTDSSSFVNTANYSYTSFSSNLNELSVSTGIGYGNVKTGYAASPSVLYTLTPSSTGPYNNELDGVAVSPTDGTVYFADQSDGVFAFPNDGHAIAIANGKPTATYSVSTQGAKTLAMSTSGDIYVAASSSAINSGGADTVGRITLDTVSVPTAPVNTATSPSSLTNPVTTLVNDAACASSPAASVTFASQMSSTASANVATSGACASTLSGGSAFPTTVSFTPLVGGAASVIVAATDQSSNSANLLVSGTGQAQIAPQTITFSNPGTQVVAVPLVLAATASSGLPVSFSSETPTVCMVSGNNATFTAAGTCTVDANQSGNSSYAAAPQVKVSFSVSPAPSFTLGVGSSTVSLNQGSSSTDTITIAAMNNFMGQVSLAVSGLPTGVTASFGTNPTADASVLTLTASSAASIGQANVTITGTAGSVTASTTITLNVLVQPSFKVSSSPSALTLVQGSNGTSVITIAAAGGFTGSVALSVSGLPAGVTTSFSDNPASTTSTLTLNATSSAALGSATVTVTGVSGSLTASASLVLTVAAPPSFTLGTSQVSVGVAQGGQSSATITVNGAGGFNSPVTLAFSALPAGVTASFSLNPTVNTSQITFSASGNAVAGSSSVTVTGTSGSLTASIPIALVVSAPAAITASAAASTLTITRGNAATDVFTIGGTGGFTGTVSLAATVTSPQNAQYPPTATFGNSNNVIVTGGGGGSATLTITTVAPTTGELRPVAPRQRTVEWAGIGSLASVLSFALFRRRRRTVRLFLWVWPILALACGGIGCGGHSNPAPVNPVGNPGTTVGTYTVTVTATSGATSTSTPIQVIVQ